MHKALLVGAGGMGRAWARTILDAHPRVLLVGWVDIVHGLAESAISDLAESLHGTVLPFTELEEAINVTKPDFVVDVSVPESHEAVTVMALSHGVPVLGEKPMSVTLDSAKRMLHAAMVADRLYMVSQSRRYDSGLMAFRNAITALGGLGILSADFFVGAHFGGFRDVMPDVLLKDMAIHTFDAARFLIGSKPLSVYCDSFRVPWTWYEGNESALATFQFESGVRFSYRGSWAAEGHQTEWEASWRAVCMDGTVTWNGADQVVIERVSSHDGFIRTTSAQRVLVEHLEHAGISGSLRDFLSALENDTEPMGICSDNIWSLAMVLYAVESSRLGQKVDIAI
jgi:predicted dehydrogenase